MALSDRLEKIKIGKTVTIVGKLITRAAANSYLYEESEYSRDALARLIGEINVASAELQYEKTAFILGTPLGGVIASYRVKNKKEYAQVLEEAKRRKLYLYYTDIKEKDGKMVVSYPLLVDWASVPDAAAPAPIVVESVNAIICPTCSKKLSSKVGLALHIKSKHS